MCQGNLKQKIEFLLKLNSFIEENTEYTLLMYNLLYEDHYVVEEINHLWIGAAPNTVDLIKGFILIHPDTGYNKITVNKVGEYKSAKFSDDIVVVPKGTESYNYRWIRLKELKKLI